MPTLDYFSILQSLAEREVEFIVVGGMSAVLRGAPLTTRDLDIVYRRDAKNIERALAALHRLDARFRIKPEMSPNASHLESTGHKLLNTNRGRLDMLGSIGKQLTYEDLIEYSDELQVDDLRVRVLRLEKLIELKEELRRDTDVAMLPVLRATLAEKRKLNRK
jgi:predicted nucleotidyltransferase